MGLDHMFITKNPRQVDCNQIVTRSVNFVKTRAGMKVGIYCRDRASFPEERDRDELRLRLLAKVKLAV